MSRQAYSKYKSSGTEWLGNVPAHWSAYRLKYCVTLVNQKLDGSESELPYTGLEHIESWTGERIAANGETSSDGQASHYERGDVLFGKLRPYLAKVLRAQEEGICTGELLVLRPKRVFQNYLFNYILTRNFISIVDSSTYGAKMPRANWEFMGTLPMLVPAEDEQCAIAGFLDRETAKIDELIEKKQRLIELLQEKRTALISHAVTKGLNPDAPMKDSGVEWLGEVPAHWSVKRLRRVGDAIIGLTYDPSDLVDEGTLVLRASNVSEGRIILEDNVFVRTTIPERLVTRVGDILICSRNGSRALIGKNAKINEDSAGVTFGAFMTIYRSPCADYLFHVFNSTLFDYQSGAFLTSTINQLTLQSLKSFEVPIPPAIEQSAIANFLDREVGRLRALQEKIGASIVTLREYRTAVISAAVTGKIDVRGEVAV